MFLAPSAQARLDHWQAVVRGAGVKLTHQRLEILRQLAQDESHPDAESLFVAVQGRLPTVSLDTVYRTLWLLHELGLITTLGPRRGGLRFDVHVEPHHHFVCTRCSAVLDFTSAELDALPLPGAARALGEVQSARVEVRGICAACQASASDDTPHRDQPHQDEPAGTSAQHPTAPTEKLP